MARFERDRLVVGLSAALAVGVPVLLLWPAPAELHDQPSLIVTPLPVLPPPAGDAAQTAPLFSEGRVPIEEAATNAGDPLAATATPAAAQLPPPTLAGIALGRGGGVALVKPASGDTVQLHVGETVDGWTLRAISRDHVVLDQGGQRMELGFAFGDKTATPAGGAGSAAAALPQIPLPPPAPRP